MSPVSQTIKAQNCSQLRKSYVIAGPPLADLATSLRHLRLLAGVAATLTRLLSAGSGLSMTNWVRVSEKGPLRTPFLCGTITSHEGRAHSHHSRLGQLELGLAPTR